jgi:hypothetical protein
MREMEREGRKDEGINRKRRIAKGGRIEKERD